ncbi:MAG: hypothetical protein QXZ17_05620 [Nitrososphaerota archaeon]
MMRKLLKWLGRLQSNPTVLFSLPDFDLATQLWSYNVKPYIRKTFEGTPVNYILLEGNAATGSNVHRTVRKIENNVKAVAGVGHGYDHIFTGQSHNVIYITSDPDTIELDFKQAEVFAPVSCLVGKLLCPFVTQKGAKSAMGEVTEYYITSAAQAFIEAEMTFWYHLARGKTAKEAYDLMLDAYERKAKELESVDAVSAKYLRFNAQNRKLFGDPNYKLVKGNEPPNPPQQKLILTLKLTSSDPFPRWLTITLNSSIIYKAVVQAPITYEIELEKDKEHKVTVDVYNPPEYLKWKVDAYLNDQLIKSDEIYGGKPSEIYVTPSQPPTPPPGPGKKVRFTLSDAKIINNTIVIEGYLEEVS